MKWSLQFHVLHFILRRFTMDFTIDFDRASRLDQIYHPCVPPLRPLVKIHWRLKGLSLRLFAAERAASLARIDPRVTSPVVLYASFFGAGVGITLLGWLVHPLIYHRRVYFPPPLPQLESPLRSCNAHLLK